MWEFLINLWCGPRWQLRPNLYPRKFFFYLILQEFCDFSGTRDLHYVIFLRIQFLDKYWFQAIFWFSSVKLDAKMDQNCKLWVHSIWAKIQNLEGFFRKFLTSQSQMLFWRNLSQIYVWIRSFIWQNLGV